VFAVYLLYICLSLCSAAGDRFDRSHHKDIASGRHRRSSTDGAWDLFYMAPEMVQGHKYTEKVGVGEERGLVVFCIAVAVIRQACTIVFVTYVIVMEEAALHFSHWHRWCVAGCTLTL
jgi:hypothetical protein